MDDPGGNLIRLGVSGPDRGRVSYWDHECESDSDTILCEFRTRVQSAKGTINVCCASPDVNQLLRLTGVDQLLKIYPDQHSALNSF
jgi:hypothetical protein